MDADDLLKALHQQLLSELLRRLKGGTKDAEGNMVEVRAADLEVARKFLIDNGVNADLARSPEGRQLRRSVVDNLPFTDRTN